MAALAASPHIMPQIQRSLREAGSFEMTMADCRIFILRNRDVIIPLTAFSYAKPFLIGKPMLRKLM